MLSELVADALRRVRIDDVMAHLARITAFDRYQASLGIEQAAALIAEAARALGLVDVTVARSVADGSTPWWTFQAPRAWTPTTARLEIAGITVDHATQPFSIATYSAPATGDLRVAHLDGDITGALVIVDDLAPDLHAVLAARGAAGFVTAAPAREGRPGRIELDARSPLFAFSITPAQRRAIESATQARVVVEIDRSAHMPVVTGVLPGGAGEIWLTSHLCHPRPGANDNASGAAALLGVAAVLADRPRAHAIRFVWGPEFLGVASLLHARLAARPRAVINFDMVGEDPVQCGVPLVVERAPEWCASPITPLAEAVVEEIFAQTRTHAGSWRPGPFFGFSDHALFATFADPQLRSPAVQLWHPGDPFNHSAADTLDKVSPIELGRATAAGAVLAELLANDADALAPIIERWCDREVRAIPAIVAHHGADAAWADRFEGHVHAQCGTMRALAGEGATAMRAPLPRKHAFAARWPGPFNYRGLLAALDASRRTAVTSLFLADKRNFAVLAHLALLADTCASRDEVIEAVSMSLRAPIDHAAACALWSALFEAGWLVAA